MLELFRESFAQRYERMRDVASHGRKVVGWLCIYVPEEIIHASGALPFRVFGGEGEKTPQADAYLYSNICSFVRSCLEEAFKGNLDFLSALVACNSCDHTRRLYDVWSEYIPTPYTKILGIPCKVSRADIKYFTRELLHFKEELEGALALSIGLESLQESIEVYNEMRTLLKRLYDLRKSSSPPITGSEVMEVILAGMVMDKREYISLLKSLLSWLDDRKPPLKEQRVRLMIVGSELNDVNFIKAIESMGGLVVTDDLCNGSRYFGELVEDSTQDPYEALARRYLSKPPCARMHPASQRVKHLQKMAQDFGVEGVIYETIKFCDIHSGIFPVIKDGFKEMGIPVLNLEREYTFAGSGQMRTRVEAFFESIGG